MDKEILYKFFDRQATASEKKEIEQWLEESQENREKLFAEREFFAAMILSGKLREKDLVVENGRKQRKITFQSRAVLRELCKIAAVIAITVSIGLFFLQQNGGDAMHTVTVPSGQRANLTLPDGTKVWMNARTEIQYPGVFSKSKREIKLNGEAYFEVSHNAKHPFIVHTNKCSIEVLGTKFNVEDYADSKDFSTALIEGSVKV